VTAPPWRLPLLAGVPLLLLSCNGEPPPTRGSSAADQSVPAAPLRPAPSDALPLDSLLALGERQHLAGEYDSARAIWSLVLGRSRTTGDSVSEARALTWTGLTAWRLGDYVEARRAGEAALALKLRRGLVADLPKSYNALGLLAWNEGRLGDALGLFDRTIRTAREAGDRALAASAAANLALVRTELGDFGEARRGLERALAAARELGETRLEGNTLNNLASLDVRVGAPQVAIPKLEQARRLYRSIGYAFGEQNALAQLGTAYEAMGEPRLALAALDSALTLSRAQGLRQEEAANLETLAGVYRQAGDLRRALELYARAAAINRELGLSVELGADLRSEAEIHRVLGAPRRARDLAREALAIHQQVSARFEELRDLLLLAELAVEAGTREEAEERLRTARTLARRLGASSARLEVALAAARIADARADSPAALWELSAAAGDVAAGGYAARHEAGRLRMRALARLGQFDSAAAAGRQAVEELERVRGAFGSAMLRTAYLADKQDVYADLIGVLRALGRPAEALQVADAARGRALVESLAAAGETEMKPWASGEQIAAGEALLLRIDALVERVRRQEEEHAAGGSPESRDELAFLRARLDTARSAYEALAVTLAEAGPVAASATALDVRGIQNSLEPRETLVEYFLAGDSLIAFALTRQQLAAVAIPVTRGQLAARVRLARELIVRHRHDPGRDLPVLGALHQLLVEPLQRTGALDRTTDLIVVPHDALAYAPFAALRDPRRDRYLVEDYALTILPSAAAFLALRTDPDVSGGSGTRRAALEAGAVFAPLLDRLPGTDVESRAVSAALGRGKAVRGPQATEAAVRKALGTSAVVHLATHAEMNPRNPLFSRIELARNGGGAAGDGRLDVHEILRLRVASRLVFLSGCETGLGEAATGGFTRGEDYATLARAFLYAGARSVVATLWRVQDRGAAELAGRFYAHYRTLGPAEALVRAQREMMVGGAYRAPYYWAGYVLSGHSGREGAQNGAEVSVR
jgi:CHAT domain-containing protein/tetratricopeptide (TPR) repeat protein